MTAPSLAELLPQEREEINQAYLQLVGMIPVPVCGLFLFVIGFGKGQLSAAADARRHLYF